MLKIIEIRPWMFLRKKKTIYGLYDFISWYKIWVIDSWYTEKLLSEKFRKFSDYITENTIWMDNRTNDCWLPYDCLLKVTNMDESKAFDLFFELLDKFIEKENIEIDQSIFKIES